MLIQPASTLIHARLAATVNDSTLSNFVEGHRLEEDHMRRIPAKMIGRALSAKEADEVLDRIAGRSKSRAKA